MSGVIPGVTGVFAAGEGGWQEFTLHGGEWFVLVSSTIVALLALAVGLLLTQGVLRRDEGSPAMVEIARAIQEGAVAYLRRQMRTIGYILVPLIVIVFFTAVAVERPDGTQALSFGEAGLFRTLTFLAGALLSGLTGFIGMSLAVRGNVRTAAAARTGKLPPALEVAFRTGGVAGMFTVGLGLLGASVIIMLFQNTSSAMLIGFGFGGSLIALFLRVGGGIYTKAADVGADLVGKVEAGIPEDDPRNPAVIADNVGDNVGDCAGMASDLFESYEVTLVAAIILGVPAFQRIFPDRPGLWAAGAMFPVAARAIGVLASIVGVLMVRATDRDRTAMAPINRGLSTAGVLTVLGTTVVAMIYIGNPADARISQVGWRMAGAVAIGLILAQIVSRITEHFTSTERSPVREIAESTETGPATTVLTGTSTGMEASVWAIVSIAIAIGVAIGLGAGDTQFSLYLVALTGMGMLATTGVVVSEDTYGPVADNAAGIAEMTGEFDDEAERVMVGLDAVGNTTKAVSKGFAIGSAVIAAVALFASFVEISAAEVLGSEQVDAAQETAEGIFALVPINVADPKVFIGLLIGGAVPFLFSSLAIRAVGRSAGVVVREVRHQFADGKVMSGERRPDYGPVIDICTAASLRELTTPALLATLTPVIIGFGIGYTALGGFLAAVILVGQLMANYLSNSGGAWDNAKKYIEDGHHGGKGSDAHHAAVIGDTVGDPFKDTAGPALNPLIKVMNLISLLILPAVIALSNIDPDNILSTTPKPAGLAIAGGALVVLLVAIAYSKRPAGLMAGGDRDGAGGDGAGTPAARVTASPTPSASASATANPSPAANPSSASTPEQT
jgi:K(+)-stimulated pyrophosphate-energized sodium pump